MDAGMEVGKDDACGGEKRDLKVIFEWERELEDFGAFAKYS
jgi:hypothetical protein